MCETDLSYLFSINTLSSSTFGLSNIFKPFFHCILFFPSHHHTTLFLDRHFLPFLGHSFLLH